MLYLLILFISSTIVLFFMVCSLLGKLHALEEDFSYLEKRIKFWYEQSIKLK